jgi:putative tryptophan/tyrosine transport system substrate-binding protein
MRFTVEFWQISAAKIPHLRDYVTDRFVYPIPRRGMRMRQREFILGLPMLACVGRASAQERARRIGVLVNFATETEPKQVLETVLKEKGWIIGRNLQIEYRITGGDTALSRAYARELLAWRPDVLLAVNNTSMAALRAEHSNIPTVFTWVSDPVGMHYVESFSRPGATLLVLRHLNRPSAANGFRF